MFIFYDEKSLHVENMQAFFKGFKVSIKAKRQDVI